MSNRLNTNRNYMDCYGRNRKIVRAAALPTLHRIPFGPGRTIRASEIRMNAAYG